MKKLTPLEYFIREIKPVPNMHYNSILELLKGYIKTHMYNMPYWELKELRDVIDEGLDARVGSEQDYLHAMQPTLKYAIEHLREIKSFDQKFQEEIPKLQAKQLEEMLDVIKKITPPEKVHLGKAYWEVEE